MPLIACPECHREVSTEAKICPGCGYPLAERNRSQAPGIPDLVQPVNTQTVILEVRPSWWNFGWHLAFSWLIVPFLIALYRRHSFVMKIYSDRVSVQEGFWSRESSEFFIKDIRSIDVQQGVWGRLVDVGNITISTAATVDAAEMAPGVPAPQKIKDLLISHRQKSAS